jgi:hypothetical protein
MNPNLRDNLNLALTVLGVLLIPLCAALFNSKIETAVTAVTAHSDANIAILKQSITENYETQLSHTSDMSAMKEWNKTLQLGQRDLSDKVDKNNVEQRLATQHISDKLDNLILEKNK